MINLGNDKRLLNRVIRISFLVIALSLTVITVVITSYLSGQVRQTMERDLQVLARVIGNRSSAAIVFNDVKTAQRNLDTTSLNSDVINACLYGSDATLFARYETESYLIKCPERYTNLKGSLVKVDGLTLVSEAITDSGEVIGFISIYASTSTLKQTVLSAVTVSLSAFVIISLIAFLLLRKSLRKAFTPLTQLHETALSIAQNPLSTDRAKRAQNDEVGRLVTVFNEMLDVLNAENKKLVSSENRFRALAENSPVGIYQMNANREFIYCNEKWSQLTGLATGQSEGDYLVNIDDSESKMYRSVLNRVEESRKPQVVEYKYTQGDRDLSRTFMEHIAPTFKDPEEGGELTGFIGSLMDISDLKNAQMELESLAFYDPLTNLPNRRFFKDHLQYVVAAADHQENKIAILMLDLDNFKKVNDTLGHDAGDELLAVLAERLKGLVASKDVVSRMGGDEFMILLKDVDVRASIKRIADRILKSIEKPIALRDHSIEVTASIGVATYPEDAESADELIRNADLALYLSKETGRNRLSFFSRKLERVINEKVRMERKIRTALKSDQFSFFVQPQWCLESGRLKSCEVLLRWFDPEEGPIGPDIFIPIAEEAGLILEIGDWLINQVIESIAKNQAKLDLLGISSLAINLSARQFFSSRLVQTFDNAFREHDVNPSMIELELTESAVMEDADLAVRVMDRLRKIGCRLSIDDFGTGYSSLSYLKKFPIDSVKIDRSFIMDIPQDQNDVEISAAIIAMGHSLGLKVVAEGVETSEQVAFLKEQGCDFAQGYFIAKPMPLEDLFVRVPEINQSLQENFNDNAQLG